MKFKIILISLAVLLVFSSVAYAVNVSNKNNTVNELLDLGNKFLIESNYSKAILNFQQVIEIQPMNVKARLGLAKAYLENKDYVAAEDTLLECLEIKPRDPQPYLMLANLYLSTGRPEKAKNILQKGFDRTGNYQIADMLWDLEWDLEVSGYRGNLVKVIEEIGGVVENNETAQYRLDMLGQALQEIEGDIYVNDLLSFRSMAEIFFRSLSDNEITEIELIINTILDHRLRKLFWEIL